jgi:Ser/Thr protein kinase RdoA (MazF antagonist)
MEPVIQKILNLYNLTAVSALEPVSGYRNTSNPVQIASGEWVNVVFYKREKDIINRIKSANSISSFLADNGFPARKTLSLNGHEIVKLDASSGISQLVCIYNYLDGNTIPWEGYTSDHIKLLGGMMGRMHRALQACPLTEMPDALTEQKKLLYCIKQYFENNPVIDAMHAKLGLILKTEALESFDSVLQTIAGHAGHPLHLDFVRGNVLFKNEPELYISGVLDFEKVAYGPRILDIARTLAFLIIDCKYNQEATIRKYFLINGYQKRGAIPLPDLKLLEELLNFFWIHDFYKFLKHNPYQNLPQNEHFQRTKDILVRRNVLSKTNG